MKKIVLFFLILLAYSIGVNCAPSLINYQGMLTDKTGNPLTTGEYRIKVIVFDQPLGGESIWDRTYEKVPVANGFFNLLVGPLNGVFNNDQAYFEFTILDDTNEWVAGARQQAFSTPYAFQAQHAHFAHLAERSANSEKVKGKDLLPTLQENVNGNIYTNSIEARLNKLENRKRKLSCYSEKKPESGVNISNANQVSVSCRNEYQLVGGGCVWRSDGDDEMIYSFPSESPNSTLIGGNWFCKSDIAGRLVEASAICCKVE